MFSIVFNNLVPSSVNLVPSNNSFASTSSLFLTTILYVSFGDAETYLVSNPVNLLFVKTSLLKSTLSSPTFIVTVSFTFPTLFTSTEVVVFDFISIFS